MPREADLIRLRALAKSPNRYWATDHPNHSIHTRDQRRLLQNHKEAIKTAKSPTALQYGLNKRPKKVKKKAPPVDSLEEVGPLYPEGLAQTTASRRPLRHVR